jgi:hypothetical protein
MSGNLGLDRTAGAEYQSGACVSISEMSDEPKIPANPVGHPLAIDSSAASATPAEPGFLARPAGTPVYHGFQVLNDVTIDGFTFGKITDFESEPCFEGDAFVIAPDNSRAGLVWKVSDGPNFHEVCPVEPERSGVWGVSFPNAMTSHENVYKNLESIRPELRKRWEAWLRKYPKE